MQILIMYHSRTGNTLKLAKEVARGVEEVEGAIALVKKAEQVTAEDVLSSAGIVAGSPVYFGSMAAELKGTFDRLVAIRMQMEDKVGAAFAVAGEQNGGVETTILSIVQAMLLYGMVIVGDPLDAAGHYGVACVGEPDDLEAELARKLGKRVARLANKLSPS